MTEIKEIEAKLASNEYIRQANDHVGGLRRKNRSGNLSEIKCGFRLDAMNV